MITTKTHIRLPAMNLRQLRGNRPRRMSPSCRCPLIKVEAQTGELVPSASTARTKDTA